MIMKVGKSNNVCQQCSDDSARDMCRFVCRYGSADVQSVSTKITHQGEGECSGQSAVTGRCEQTCN